MCSGEPVEKGYAFSDKGSCGLLQRTRCPSKTDNSHVCRPRSVFSDAHVAGENRSHLIRGVRAANSTRFFDKLQAPGASFEAPGAFLHFAASTKL